MADDLLVGGDDVVVDVETALVAHYRVQDCAWLLLPPHRTERGGSSLQKKEPGFFSALRWRSMPMAPTASTAAALGA